MQFMALLFIGMLVAGSILAWVYIDRHRKRQASQTHGNVREFPMQPPIEVSNRERFTRLWNLCQTQFVEDPRGAVDTADRLLDELMRNREFPGFVTVSPTQAMHFREAREIAAQHRRGEASMEDLKIAFIHFRALFDTLFGTYDVELQRAS